MKNKLVIIIMPRQKKAPSKNAVIMLNPHYINAASDLLICRLKVSPISSLDAGEG